MFSYHLKWLLAVTLAFSSISLSVNAATVVPNYVYDATSRQLSLNSLAGGLSYICTDTGATCVGSGMVTPQQFNPTAGTGGDDSAAIQAAINLISINGGILYFPPTTTGYYVCSAPITISGTGNGQPIVLHGAGPGAPGISVKPGCSNPPAEVFYVNEPVGSTTAIKSVARVVFEDLRIDGNALANYDVLINYAIGLSFFNCILRNVSLVSGSANLKMIGGYELTIDHSNRLENLDDTGTLYTVNYPDYNFWTSGTDGLIGAVAINARVAHYHQDLGGGNHFVDAHGWSQNALGRSAFGFEILGIATLISTYADSYGGSGYYINPRHNDGVIDNGGIVMFGNLCQGSAAIGSVCITIDNTSAPLMGSTIIGNNFYGDVSGSGIGNGINIINGPLNPSNLITLNNGITENASGTVWNTYTPTVTCGSGTVTNANATGRWKAIGKTTFVNVTMNIVSNGTCATSILVSMPFTGYSGQNAQGVGREYGISGKQLQVGIPNASANAIVRFYDGTFPGQNGASMSFSVTYEAN